MKIYGKLKSINILISGSVDEVMSRTALQQLQWCQIAAPVLSGALWMPKGNLNMALRTDFPVDRRPHTFAMPTIYRWKEVKTGESSGRRLFDFDFMGKYVAGGIHMTTGAFIPTTLLKELTATEHDFYNSSSINLPYLLTMTSADMALEQKRIYNLTYWKIGLSLPCRDSG